MSPYTQAADEMREAGERHNSSLREMASLREALKAPDPDTRAAANLQLDAAYHRMLRSRAELEQKTDAFLEVSNEEAAHRQRTAAPWPLDPLLVEDPLYCPGDEATYGDPHQ